MFVLGLKSRLYGLYPPEFTRAQAIFYRISLLLSQYGYSLYCLKSFLILGIVLAARGLFFDTWPVDASWVYIIQYCQV